MKILFENKVSLPHLQILFIFSKIPFLIALNIETKPNPETAPPKSILPLPLSLNLSKRVITQ